ncbi:MAG TPA: Error-prone repair protein ImuA, partial [Chitinophagaceae bacterium]|nr:Error-prone repair protein ImuA [Chitinophagaceae bacterium]
MEAKRSDIVAQLQKEILRRQGFCSPRNTALDIALGPIRDALPDGMFPAGAVHEFLSTRMEDMAATNGFVTGILAAVMGDGGIAIWVSATRNLFPPAVANFGVDPERI